MMVRRRCNDGVQEAMMACRGRYARLIAEAIAGDGMPHQSALDTSTLQE